MPTNRASASPPTSRFKWRSSDPLLPTALEKEIASALHTFDVTDKRPQRYLRAFGTNDKVNGPFTLKCRLPIGSNTKLVHLFALAHLLEEKGYTMDTPIKQLMPDFEVSDKQAEGQWTCADIYSHMTGLSGYELVFEEGMSVKQALDSLQVLRPNVPFRSRFQYSNLPFNIIDRLVTHLSGKAFPAYVKEHVLDPIGLSSTVYKEDDLVPKGWWKTYGPDVDFEGGYQMKETGFVAGQCKALRAPGGSLMSGEDLLKWIECLPKHPIYHLASQPRVQLGQGFHSHSYPYEAATYGLATAQTTYNKSHRVVEHVGNASGYRAFVMDLPDLGIRIGMMSNASPSEPGAGFRDWLRSRLLGHFTEESVCGANEALLSQ
ncbi:hypothetical protein I317_06582 [Kwoniella heveanensis CBS 569]|nr:hypothetical protein I317_06582 [Kwoniella heveanensis CBS 569]